ncbi:class IV adenylate cyclase [Clostridium transplantifaecale]|uniref:class IV adenylate cyclase n=1 Tax=Clostridium transplantifaecale TaxID=2479838 RepID=UPI000F639343|nr:class IV adenylate cyclase [Clostridium transplantifaecale]
MDNKEFEVKLELTPEEAQEIYRYLVNDLNGIPEIQKDIYYCPVQSDVRQYMNTKCVRIRTRNKKITLDYKEIIDEKNTYIQKLTEYSTGIEDDTSMDLILRELGLVAVLKVQKERVESIHKEIFKIALDNVEDLGWFIEIELLNHDGDESVIENKMIKVIEELGIKEVRINKTGYSNMLLNNHYGEEK